MALGSSGVLRTRRDHSQGLTKHRLLLKRADLKAIALVFHLTQLSSLLLGEISHPATLMEITITAHFFCPSKSPFFYGLLTDVFIIGVVTCA